MYRVKIVVVVREEDFDKLCELVDKKLIHIIDELDEFEVYDKDGNLVEFDS